MNEGPVADVHELSPRLQMLEVGALDKYFDAAERRLDHYADVAAAREGFGRIFEPAHWSPVVGRRRGFAGDGHRALPDSVSAKWRATAPRGSGSVTARSRPPASDRADWVSDVVIDVVNDVVCGGGAGAGRCGAWSGAASAVAGRAQAGDSRGGWRQRLDGFRRRVAARHYASASLSMAAGAEAEGPLADRSAGEVRRGADHRGAACDHCAVRGGRGDRPRGQDRP